MRRRKTEREVLLVLVLAAWCCCTLATEGANDPLQQPHIVLIVADDLGWNDVPWHNAEVQAPNLLFLAREGVILEQSYVQPICSPSRSALMSGHYPYTIGRQHSVISNNEPTGLRLNLTLMPETLKEVGYETHMVGKWHLGFCSWAYTPTKRGFDTFYGYYTGSEYYYCHSTSNSLYKEDGEHSNHINMAPQAPRIDKDCNLNLDEDDKLYLDLRNNTKPDRNESGIYSTYIFASQAENILTQRNPQVPLFLYLPFQSVHAPLEVPDKYKEPYAHITDEDRKTYLGMVSALDEAVGRVVKTLKDTGHYNNSVIVFTTDNGGPTAHGSNNWPLRGNKTTIWEGGTRGAAFVHSLFLPNPGTVNPMLMHITDWLPTLVGLAGGEVPQGIDGVDQWASLTGEAPPARAEFIYNIDNTTEFLAGIRVGRYKLLVGNPGPGEWTPPPTFTEVPTNYADDADNDNVEGDDEELEKETDEEEEQTEEEIITASYFVGGLDRLLEKMTGSNTTEIRLYDLEYDPEEKINVAASEKVLVAVMAELINLHLARYTPADEPARTNASDPQNFDDVWSPGWC